MADTPTPNAALNLVGGLSVEVERVAAKLTRWKGYCRDMPEMARGMRPAMALMTSALTLARTALNLGDIEPMLAALQNLREYDDND